MRMLLTRIALLVASLVVGEAVAQPRLAVAPDTLFLINPGEMTEGENEVKLWNAGTDTLRIDSLRFSTFTATGWGVSVSLPDTTFEFFFAFGERADPPGAFPMVELPPLDSIEVELGFNGCLICGGKQTQPSAVRDTLFIYSNDEAQSPYFVPIDFAFYVATEPPDEVPETASLQVFPNPARGQARIEVRAAQAGPHEIAVYDLLGRRRYHVRKAMLPGETWSPAWPEDSLPSGTYFVHLRTNRRAFTKALAVVK